jgi:Ca2+-transporting ATPase
MTRRTLPLSRLQDLLSTDRGLTSAEVIERRERYGPNDIIQVAGNPWWDLARDTAKDPMLWFLIGTSVIYAFIGELLETVTLAAAIIPLAGMDAFLHRRTSASTEGLSGRLAVRATVMRDGAPVEIPAVEVVPGDLAIVSAAEPFPADGLVISGAALQVDESALTGEAFPVRKQVLREALDENPEPAVAGEHWGFAGTRLLTGPATLRVVFTGAETVYGEIVNSAVSGARARTPLQAAIARLVSILIAAAAVTCFILALVRLYQGYGWIDALVSAVTLAVAALPEEFPVVFTFFLGVGVYRLAKRQALVRRAVSIENLGRVSCICADKTGTMTEGILRLTHLVPADGLSEQQLLALAALASRHDSNDPLDTAILHEMARTGAPPAATEVLELSPFTEASRRETAVVRDHEGVVFAATKGSPEVIGAMSKLPDAEWQVWSERLTALASEGHKVIGCAWRPLGAWQGGTPEHGYRFAGLLALEDPVREGVSEAILRCREAGIHTVMVTGDHPVTARAVAKEIGLGGDSPRVISAEELGAYVSYAGDGAPPIDVIARAAPAEKLSLVQALQARGEIVAVTGDGVNDVPALQAADIGIAMGERGTRSAREIAAIVLLDDNFRTIVRAIGEGRQLFRNLQLSFQYLLMIHIPLVITAALIPLAGYPLLYLPIHVVWLELIIHPTALLVFQEIPAGERLARMPTSRVARFFSRREWGVIAAIGALVTASVIIGYVGSLGEQGSVEHARAMAVAVLTFTSAGLTAATSRLRTRISRLIVAGTVALTVILIQTPVLAKLLHVEPLHWANWLTAIGAAAIVGTIARLWALSAGYRN